MPLRATQNNKSVFAFDYSKEEWGNVKMAKKGIWFVMPCCNTQAIPKTSQLGAQFFSHVQRGNCRAYENEPKESLFIKTLIYRAAKKTGWGTYLEEKLETPDGKGVRADVMVISPDRSKSIVFLVQMTRQPIKTYLARQRIYDDLGVDVVWIVDNKFKDSLKLYSSSNIKVFYISPTSIGTCPRIEPFPLVTGRYSKRMFVDQFVNKLIDEDLIWCERDSTSGFYVYSVKGSCYRCGNDVNKVCGLFPYYGENQRVGKGYIALGSKEESDKAMHHVLSEVGNNQLSQKGLNTISKVRMKGHLDGGSYCSNCVHCGAPENNWFLTKNNRSRISPLDNRNLDKTKISLKPVKERGWILS